MSTIINREYRVYLYKRWFIWVGWIVENTDTIKLYCDNDPTITMYPESSIIYLSFALSFDRLFDRTKKKIKKIYKIKEE